MRGRKFVYIQGGPQTANFSYALTSANIDHFSNSFHC